jgi:hypothetical protein
MALSEHEGIGIVSGQHAAYRDAICNLRKAIRITCLSVKRKTQNTKYIARGTCDGAPTAYVT